MSHIQPMLTLSTCWYNLHSKFPSEQYLLWIQNFFSLVDNFNLVVYTDSNGIKQLQHIIHKYLHILHTKIKLIVKPITDFYGYKYKEYWIKNQKSKFRMDNNSKNIDWELYMLWCEKIHFVKETIDNKYFDTLFYGWCDIGYFRNRANDTNIKDLIIGHWGGIKVKKNLFTETQIHYACVQNNKELFYNLQHDIVTHYINKSNNKNINKNQPFSHQLTNIPCFAGGFFILNSAIISQYVQLFDYKLNYYFSNEYFVKDDQTIIKDCIFTNPHLFYIHFENTIYDNWFMFQRLLL